MCNLISELSPNFEIIRFVDYELLSDSEIRRQIENAYCAAFDL